MPNASQPSSHSDSNLAEARAPLRPWRTRTLLLSFACCAALFGYEIVHYVMATDLGTLDHLPSAWAPIHPGCQELKGPYDLRCPLPGYNSVQLACLWELCTFADPDGPVTTEKVRQDYADSKRQDELDSLVVEAPYASRSAAWQAHARDLRTGSIDPFPPDLLSQKSVTPTEALTVIRQRGLQISRQNAQEWLKQHGN